MSNTQVKIPIMLYDKIKIATQGRSGISEAWLMWKFRIKWEMARLIRKRLESEKL